MRYFDAFAGYGGFSLGIKRAYETKNRRMGGDGEENIRLERSGSEERDSPGERYSLPERPDGHAGNEESPSCVGYSEVDRYAIQTYQKHFPEHKNYGDITKINERELPDFDLFVGGFPCQAFSIAGNRRGFEDTRGTLFFDIARILRAKRPRLILLENVKGLLSHDAGRTFKTIISTLAELGYDLQWQVLNSKNFGVPQNRERVFIVGHLRGEPRPQIFPFGISDKEHTGKTDEQGCASTLTGRNAGGQNRRGNYVVGTLRTHKDGEGFREVKSGLAPTLPARAREDGSGQPVVMSGRPTYENGKRKVEYSESEVVPTIRATHYKSGDNQPVVLGEGMKIRRLTPVECERLMGLPDGWTEGVSETQRYKLCGNGVVVNVVEEIIKRLIA